MVKKIQKPRSRRLVRYCVIADCAKKLSIVVRPDKSYSGGNYFPELGMKKEKKSEEYWECKDCYGRGSY